MDWNNLHLVRDTSYVNNDLAVLHDSEILKYQITASLKRQGFDLRDGRFLLPKNLNKQKLRKLHSESVRQKIEIRKKGLIRHERSLLERFAAGEEIVPEQIAPKLVKVESGSKDELLFRYATLHWSIPVSSGYGRRLRFLVIDQKTDKLMGLFGLGDPVFSLKDRDSLIGWTHEDRQKRLHHVLDAYVLGAVPPYSFLLGGKLIALLAISNEVREAFKRKYEARASLIQERELPGQIALITTTSALGRSSLYNRLEFDGCLAFKRVGYTKGFGEFHFSNGVYDSMTNFAKENAVATAKHGSWGGGFRNRREVVQKTLAKLEISQDWRNHGIKREIYAASLARNTYRFLRGKGSDLEYYDRPANDLFEWFRERWLLPRSESDERYKNWHPSEWALWQAGEEDERIG